MGRKKRTSKPVRARSTDGGTPWLTIVGARQNNLKNVTVGLPLARFVCVTGVSGSGKSSLINDILHEALLRDLNFSESAQPGDHDRIDGLVHLDKVINIDQSPIGRTPRSNPSTYVKVFDEIRDLFARLPDAKVRGYKPGRFSFNVATGKPGGGRCEACEGYGSNKMEMDFLADVWVTCPVCGGKRFNHETLQVLYKGKSIAEVLDMDVQQALDHFANVPAIASMLRTLHEVGLDYVKLGQSSTTLSGGEAQRIKLARELVKKSTGRTMYLLDEPTTGLHFDDIKKLLAVLHGFVDAGNSVVVIEHNLDVIKTADWVIDLGPEGGEAGGRLVAAGTPERVAACDASHTGTALRDVLNVETSKRRNVQMKRLNVETPRRLNWAEKIAGSRNSSKVAKDRNGRAIDIEVVGARQHNLKNINVTVPRGKMTTCCGPSGSGKTSFAVDTVYSEGQRRYVESLSSYARQFLGRMQPAKVDHVHGLSPAICIEQRSTSKSPRSTVGTVTEVYDYMRVLWARIGKPYCPKCRKPVGAQSADEIVEKLLSLGEGMKLFLLAPIEPAGQESFTHLLQRERANGYARARIDGVVQELSDGLKVDEKRRLSVELVVDRVVINRRQRARLNDSVEQALRVGQGVLLVQVLESSDSATGNTETVDRTVGHQNSESSRGLSAFGGPGRHDMRFSQHRACEECGESYEELSPHHFSFNSRLGWCDACEGLGTQKGASPASIVVQPTRSIVDGAIAGWGQVKPESKLYVLASALAEHLGFDVHRPWDRLTEAQRLSFLQGSGDEWVETSERRNVETSKPMADLGGVRFKWRGFYPAIHRATQMSMRYRARLDEMVVDVPCERCRGSRLRKDAAAVQVTGATLHDLCMLPMGRALEWFESLKLPPRERKIAGELLHEITSRLRFLVDVGLEYINLHRPSATLSGGEAQRIQLAAQIGTGLTGVLYVLDEPTIGLHPRDNIRLIRALSKLRDLGNTLLLVEHDREVIDASDHVLDFGPGAGSFGGEVTAAADPRKLRTNRKSLTGKYLSLKESIPVPSNRRPVPRIWRPIAADVDLADTQVAPRDGQAGELNYLVVHRARENNLKEIDAAFPLGRFTCVTGVSGSGKSTLVSDILSNALLARIHRAAVTSGAHDSISGVDHVDKIINVDQTPIGNTPTSNPATYTGLFDAMRELFAKLPLSKIRGYTPNRFSFNRVGGRCEACQGMGAKLIEMHFLPDVWVECDNCAGKRYTAETLEVKYKEKSIADVLEMRVSEALQLFENVPKLNRLLKTLDDVGLGYVQLGQSATTLSGGEAQRVKLAAELGRPSTGKTLYVLDEPTTGLHFDDLKKLLDVLHRLVDLGNTVICIEHNLDIIKTADWIIDLGPEGGEQGGHIVIEGTPETVAKHKASFTGAALRSVLEAGPMAERRIFTHGAVGSRGRSRSTPKTEPFAPAKAGTVRDESAPADDISDAPMPWERDGRAWHTVNPVDGNGRPVEWDVDLLVWLVDTMESVGRFETVNWNHRTKVELFSGSGGAWFCHILTGYKDVIDVAIRVAGGTFSDHELRGQLKIKSLDERTDLPIYGQSERVRIRTVPNGWQEIRLSLRDFKDVDQVAFRKFLSTAARSYGHGLERFVEKKQAGMPWETDGQAWHLSQESITKPHLIRWKPATLMALVGRFKSIEPAIDVRWDGKVMIRLWMPGDGTHAARIITNLPQGLRVELNAPRGAITPTMIEGLGKDATIKPAGEGDWVVFWVTALENNDVKQLREVWSRCRGLATSKRSEPFAQAKDESNTGDDFRTRSVAMSG